MRRDLFEERACADDGVHKNCLATEAAPIVSDEVLLEIEVIIIIGFTVNVEAAAEAACKTPS